MTLNVKQFSPSCDHNRNDILPVLIEIAPADGMVLEVGSGTGQHAVYFAQHLPQLQWQPSDLAPNHASIHAWKDEAALTNVLDPIVLDLLAGQWPQLTPSLMVCINTVHIVAWPGVQNLFRHAAQQLAPGGLLYVYGAYRYATRPLEPSNERFDQWLKARDPASGVRDFEAVNALAHTHGLALVEDRAMPGNNRSIWWVKTSK